MGYGGRAVVIGGRSGCFFFYTEENNKNIKKNGEVEIGDGGFSLSRKRSETDRVG